MNEKTTVTLADGTELVFMGKLSADEVSAKVGEFRASRTPPSELPGSTPRLRAQVRAPEPPTAGQEWVGGYGKLGGQLAKGAGAVLKGAYEMAKPNSAGDYVASLFPGGLPLKRAFDGALEMNSRAQVAKSPAESIAYSAAAALPFVGPMAADLGEDIGKGELGTAVGKVGTMAAMGAGQGAFTRWQGKRAVASQARAQVAAEAATKAVQKPVQEIVNSVLGPTARNPRAEQTFEPVLQRIAAESDVKTTGMTVDRASTLALEIAKKEGGKFEVLAKSDMPKPIAPEQVGAITAFLDERIANELGTLPDASVVQLQKLRTAFDKPHTVESLNRIQKRLNDETAKMFHTNPRAAEAMAADPYWGVAKEVRGMVADTVYKNLSDPRAKESYQMSGKASEVATEMAQRAVLARREVASGSIMPSPWEGAEAGIGVGTGNPGLATFAAMRYATRRMSALRQNKLDHPDYVLTEQLKKIEQPKVAKPSGDVTPPAIGRLTPTQRISPDVERGLINNAQPWDEVSQAELPTAAPSRGYPAWTNSMPPELPPWAIAKDRLLGRSAPPVAEEPPYIPEGSPKSVGGVRGLPPVEEAVDFSLRKPAPKKPPYTQSEKTQAEYQRMIREMRLKQLKEMMESNRRLLKKK